MSQTEPGICRSTVCDAKAVAYARQAGRVDRRTERWDGEFCLEHLLPCLAVKVPMLRSGQSISIEPIKWEQKS